MKIKHLLKKFLTSLILILSIYTLAYTQEPDIIPPKGLFVCRGRGNAPVEEVDYPFIKGWLVRPRWYELEPSEGRYDFSFIKKEISTAKRLGKKITLAILCGPHTPKWVYSKGAKQFNYTVSGRYTRFQGVETDIPLIWDEVFLQKWTNFIQALGKQLAYENTITLVHITGATANGFEMQLPFLENNPGQWKDLGYSPEKVISAWKRIIDAFAKAFPSTSIDIDIHKVLASDKIAEEVANYGFTTLGKRFGIFAGWLSGKNKEHDYSHSGMQDIANKYGQLTFLNFQLIGNQTRQPERFADEGITGAIQQGMNWGARYFEIWGTDVSNKEIQPILKKFSEELEAK